MSTLSERGVRDVGPQPVRPPEAKSSLGTAASGGAVFQKSRRATNPEKKSIGSTATVELTTAHGTPVSRKRLLRRAHIAERFACGIA